jgi:two-component system copper resistance phosphate regulon response regulator CusR
MSQEQNTEQTQATRILFVDDDRILLEAFRDRFVHMGYNVVVATSGKDALHLVKEFQIDIAVLDVSMPEMDGFKLIRAIRQILPQLPILFLTGNQDRETFLKAFELRSNSLIEKPCTFQELDFQIRRLLSGIRSRRVG